MPLFVKVCSQHGIWNLKLEQSKCPKSLNFIVGLDINHVVICLPSFHTYAYIVVIDVSFFFLSLEMEVEEVLEGAKVLEWLRGNVDIQFVYK